jgi:hypothetical protein
MPPLPRVGLTLTLPASLSRVAYFGHGPHECYTDRRQGAPLGAYETTVDDTCAPRPIPCAATPRTTPRAPGLTTYPAPGSMVPYLAPSENGARAGVRWAAFVDASGHGLAVAAPSQGETFLFSAHRCTPFDLHGAKHPHEIPLRDEAAAPPVRPRRAPARVACHSLCHVTACATCASTTCSHVVEASPSPPSLPRRPSPHAACEPRAAPRGSPSPPRQVTLQLDHRHMPCGGNDSWSRSQV